MLLFFKVQEGTLDIEKDNSNTNTVKASASLTVEFYLEEPNFFLLFSLSVDKV